MPIQQCQKNDKPGFRWGNEGKCYTYSPNDEESKKRAKNKAIKQGQAIEISKKLKGEDNHMKVYEKEKDLGLEEVIKSSGKIKLTSVIENKEKSAKHIKHKKDKKKKEKVY